MRRALGYLLCLLICPWQLWASSEIRSLLVFPFDNDSPRADLNWISESFAQVLSSRLPQPDNYVLDRGERNAAYTQLGIPMDAPLTLASEYRVAQTLGVDWAILGNFNVTDNRLVAHAQLLDVKHLHLSQPLEVGGDLTELIDLQTRLAWRLLAMNDRQFTVSNEDDFRRRFQDIRLDAFENYIRGLLANDDASRVHFFTESNRLDPSDHRAAFALGKLYFDRKDYTNSAPWLAKIGQADPDYNESLFLRGVDEFLLGQETASEGDFEALAKVLPLGEVSNNLGVLETRSGRYTEAAENFEHAYQSDPSDPDYCFNRGVALWYQKRYLEAAEALRAALGENADDVEAHTLLAMVLGKMGDTAAGKAEDDWLAAHEVGAPAAASDVPPLPRLKKSYDGRAFRLLELTLHNALEERLARATPQEHSDAHLAEGRRFLAVNRYGEAERQLSEVVALSPDDPQAHLLLSQALEAEGKYHAAEAEAQESLRLKDTAEAHLSLAHALLSMNQRELARLQGLAALQLEPGNREAQQFVQQFQTEPPATRKMP